ncbi:MAG: DUF2194 domain-containing protein [Leptotrichiaceae bacterium]|nr:DUF2194 domain-containing protein [Leptotrichiaceae bacterium]MBP6280902.1 DUF2194 domain-containing protein [Leptotrichiaceae bacterium]MBP7101558.1 DUF2194 domain-containing protein [Leptotrichiaceae bacterium]MBP7739379.1 DUF2194 domain-containing protein [Leptotrichiaceae bacterium]MBP9629367.1 DUF2194 domain-containing protein [Leptotrichiaceae bacterium]
MNRLINKVNYFEINQDVSLEKSIAKSTKQQFSNPQKILVYYNGTSEQSKSIVLNVKEIFNYNKINYKLVDIGEEVSTKEYSTFIFATDTFIGFKKVMFDKIIKEVFNGKNLIFLNNSPYNPFNEISGINKINKLIDSSKGIKFIEKLFPGIDTHEPSEKMVVFPTMKVELKKNLTIFATDEKNNPVLWEKIYGSGRILYTNASFFSDKVTRGLMNQWISYGNDWYITPILNARLMHIDDFPAPIPRTENSVITNHYHVSTRDFFRQIWWKDMIEIGRIRNIVYSGFIIIDYNHDVIKEDMKDILDITLKDLSLNGRELFNNKGELGIHGYNHNPLLYYSKDINFEGLNYKPWITQQDMAASTQEVLKYVKELFGKKVKLYTYVPPSNMMKEEGVKVVVENYPDLKTISSVFYGTDSEGVYVQEVGRNKLFPNIYNLPRFSSGFYYDSDEMWNIFNAFAIYGYWSHFVHPDDLISTDRSQNKTWEQLKIEFEKTLTTFEEKLPFVNPMRSVDMTKKYMNIEDLEIYSEKRNNEIHIGIKNFRDNFETLIRINGNDKIKNISSGSFKEIYSTRSSKIYLINIEKEDIIIYLGG